MTSKATLKKGAVLVLATTFGLSAVFAQNEKQSHEKGDATPSSAKIFGGAKQYRTWSVGVHGGVLLPVVVTGGGNNFRAWDAQAGYGLFIKKQLAPAFALKLDAHRGKLSGATDMDGDFAKKQSVKTDLNYAVALKGVVNVGTVSFLKRKKALGFFVQAGYGISDHKRGLSKEGSQPGMSKSSGIETFIPVGLGANFKLGNVVDLVLGYDMNFSGAKTMFRPCPENPGKDKWSYGYAGLEFHLGKKSKPNLQWSDPVAMLYDELKGGSVKDELAALSQNMNASETKVDALYKDSDGDGVSDVFDKEPNTPAGSPVDGAGRTIMMGKKAAGGAPVAANTATEGLQDADKATLEAAKKDLRFVTGKAIVSKPAYQSLDKLAALMKSNKTVSFDLTSAVQALSKPGDNNKLAADRIAVVKAYFAAKGITQDRIK